MKISVPTETAPREQRVALAPDSVARLVKQLKLEVVVQRGAGLRAGFRDDAYQARRRDDRRPTRPLPSPAAPLDREGPAARRPGNRADSPRARRSSRCCDPDRAPRSSRRSPPRSVTALALELVPRITRAQSMDVLSSQSTVSGYKGVLIGAVGARQVPADAHDRGRQHLAGEGLRHRRGRRRTPGDRDRPPTRRRRLGVRRAAGGARAGAEPRRDVRRERAGRRRRAGGRRLRARADARTSRRARSPRSANHIKDQDLVVTTAQIPGRAGAEADHRRDGGVDARRLGDRRPGRGDGRQLRALEAGRDGAGRTTSRSSRRSTCRAPWRSTPARCSAATSSSCSSIS